MAQTFDFRQTYFGQPRWRGSEGQFAYLYGIVVLNSQSYRDNTCPSLLISYTSGLSTPHMAAPSIIPSALIKPIHTALKPVSRRQFFIFGKLSLKGSACAEPRIQSSVV
jgi:hypothetical protein